MFQNTLFGRKEMFAIELEYSKNPKKFYLRFWIQNLPMGTFKKAGDLKFSVDTFKRILDKKKSMFLPVFDSMTATEIHDYTKINHDNEEELKRLQELVPLYKLAFFGKQFTDTQSEYLILYRDEELQFIWKNDFNQSLNEGKIAFSEFCRVFNQYLEYCTQKKLI